MADEMNNTSGETPTATENAAAAPGTGSDRSPRGASGELLLIVLTPHGEIFRGSGDSFHIRTSRGDVEIEAGFEDSVFDIVPCPAEFIVNEGEIVRFAVHDGFFRIRGTEALVLAGAAEREDEIDHERAREARTRAMTRLEKAKHGRDTGIDVERARAALRRAKTRLAVLLGEAKAEDS